MAVDTFQIATERCLDTEMFEPHRYPWERALDLGSWAPVAYRCYHFRSAAPLTYCPVIFQVKRSGEAI